METQNIDNKRIAKNTIFLYIRMLFVLIVTLYTTRIVLNELGIEDYGIYNIVCGFVALFGFLNTSLSQAIQRFYNYELGKGDREAVSKVFNTSIVIQLLLIFLLLIIIELIGYYWFSSKLVVPDNRRDAAWIVFQFSIVSMFVNILSTPYSAMILSFERMNYYALVSITDAVLKLLVAISLSYVTFDKLIYYGSLLLMTSILNLFMYSVYCHKKFSFRINFQFDKQLLRPMFEFSGWNIFGSFASIIKTQGTNILLNSFFGVVVNASSGIAAQISSAIQHFSLNIVLAFRPQLITAYSQGNIHRVQKMMFTMSKIGFMLVFMLSIPVILEIDYILELWLGGVVPVYAPLFSKLTIAAMIIGVFNTPITQVIQATGKIKLYQIVTSIVMCSILPVSWILFKIGYNSSVIYWVTIIITAINQIFSLRILHNKFLFSYKIYLKKIIIPCLLLFIASPILPSILSKCAETSIYRLIVVCISSCISVIVLGYFILLDKYEKGLVKGYILNKFCNK